MKTFYDSHIHIVNVNDFPMITFQRRYGKMLSIFLKPRISSVDNRLRHFVTFGQKTHCDQLHTLYQWIFPFINQLGFTDIVLTPLLMYFEKEDSYRSLEKAIKNIQNGITSFHRKNSDAKMKIYPFLGLDPTAQGIDYVSLINRYITRNNPVSGDFIGIKFYPPLNLDISAIPDDFFSLVAEREIPITIHGAAGGFISEHLTRREAKKYCDPGIWEKIVKKHPTLKINFAHFGGLDNSFKKSIIKMIKTYDNVFTDIACSFTMALNYPFPLKPFTYRVSKILNDSDVKNKVVYGSDFPVVIPYMKGNSGNYDILLRDIYECLGNDNFTLIAQTNPKVFLGI